MLRLSLLLTPLAGACLPPVCTSQTPLGYADGGAYRCIQAVDCPRPSNVLVCASTDDQAGDCVSCVDTTCVRFTRAECR